MEDTYVLHYEIRAPQHSLISLTMSWNWENLKGVKKLTWWL